MFSISTTPAKQSATDTITVLSGRLSSATLLEDRRAAILGLRSFAKDLPATVSSSALRGLIGSLTKDGEDVDTVKIVLETLLMLFNPNEDSPEASDEIALWLADEFTQRQENITLLLDFLDSSDFYSRLYPLQLLGAILVARTERTEECIFTAPLGISRLVAILDDHRDAIRNESISLLTGLTPTSTDIQKLVAFENAFEKTFSIIEADGSLNEGGRTVEDCLIFLANLLRRNPSNQALFRESGGIKRMADLLRSLPDAQSSENGVSPWAWTQRNRNLFAYLSIVRLLLPGGSAGVLQNQNLLWKYGLCHDILQLAFSSELEIQIQAEALLACGDMIRDATTLQETFAQLTVNRPAAAAKSMQKDAKIYIIDGLLDLILNLQDSATFDLRYAASECLKAYFSNHLDVRMHFLGRAIDGYSAGSDESSNVLTVLLRPAADLSAVDPYRQWFACVITIHLLYDNPSCKAKALAIAEGDSSDGEEVVTSIQTITAHLITGISRGDDCRILIGYLMLLCTWLFEDLDAVNDFLSEGSNVQSLIQAIFQPTVVCNEIVQGLCAMLLGIVYEFSTKDSPISRTALHTMLTSRLDRERYLDRLIKLRSHPLLRDFETIPQKRDPGLMGGHPEVFFDPVFVNFFKDNYGRVSRALDRSPELEISVITNGVQKGISRELVDSLREQLKAKDQTIEELKTAQERLEARVLQEQADHRQSQQNAAKELAEARSGQDGLEKSHQDELLKLQREQGARVADVERRAAALQASIAAKDSDHQKEISQVRRVAQADADSIRRRNDAEMADLKATISNLQVDLQKAVRDRELESQAKASELEDRDEEIMALSEQHTIALSEEQAKTAQLTEQTKQLQAQLRAIQASSGEDKNSDQAERLMQVKKEKEAAQSELDDLLMVFADLEEQAAKQKARLRELGEAVSDGEDDWE